MTKKLYLIIVAFFVFSSIMAQPTKAYHYTNEVVSLPDGSGVCYTSTIIIDNYSPDQTIESPYMINSICSSLEHSYLGDLTIQLQAPNGQIINLVEQGGASTHLGEPIDNGYVDNNEIPGVGYDYCWNTSPEYGTFASEAESYTTLPAGSYTPQEDFSNLVGSPINGPWTIIICDNWSSDDGYMFGWSIDILTETTFNNRIAGYVYADLNYNNIYDGDDYPMQGRLITVQPGNFYGYTNSYGYYSIHVPLDTYTVHQQPIQDPFYQSYPTEPDYHTVEFLNEWDSIYNQNFYNQMTSVCPDLSVDVTLDGVGPCSLSRVFVLYENNGTVTAENSYITLTFDENFTASWLPPNATVDGNVITYDIGDIAPGESGHYLTYLEYSCDVDLVGTTVCLEAHIYPDDPCEEPAEEWDKSSVMVTGECVDNEDVCFTITNTGDPGEGDMDGTSEYRVYENDELVETGTFQLTGGETITYCWAANGSTIRFEADQRPFHPGNSHPQEAIEGCGEGDTDIGFILNFPQDDLDDFIEIECQEVLSSFDPNDKSVTPQGITENHFIDSTTTLEYKIRFQNTGTAPANNVYIYDTISNYLDISCFCFMSSSHTCTVDILQPNVIKWSFEGINLPDSTNNEPESHGYVKYKIQQTPGNELMSVITNSAAIIFDYNYPVITNEVFNTIGYFTEIITPEPIIYNDVEKISVYPNPASDIVFFETNNSDFKVEIYNISGQKVSQRSSEGKNIISLSTNELSNGMYIYTISDKSSIIATGKLLIEK